MSQLILLYKNNKTIDFAKSKFTIPCIFKTDTINITSSFLKNRIK